MFLPHAWRGSTAGSYWHVTMVYHQGYSLCCIESTTLTDFSISGADNRATGSTTPARLKGLTSRQRVPKCWDKQDVVQLTIRVFRDRTIFASSRRNPPVALYDGCFG
ncbi:hypothetical protein PM082_019185 [Marasmius tenuissimus]|nr:hypothetical protein PM082_019185 [Marasmius tenuissimus]